MKVTAFVAHQQIHARLPYERKLKPKIALLAPLMAYSSNAWTAFSKVPSPKSVSARPSAATRAYMRRKASNVSILPKKLPFLPVLNRNKAFRNKEPKGFIILRDLLLHMAALKAAAMF